MCSFFNPTSFSQPDCFEIYSCSYMYQLIIFFFNCEWHSIVDLFQVLLVPSSIRGHLGCFQFEALSNKVAMNIHVKRKRAMCVCM